MDKLNNWQLAGDFSDIPLDTPIDIAGYYEDGSTMLYDNIFYRETTIYKQGKGTKDLGFWTASSRRGEATGLCYNKERVKWWRHSDKPIHPDYMSQG